MEKETQHGACPECGARLAPGAEVCGLCGLPVGPRAEEAADAEPAWTAGEAEGAAAEGASDEAETPAPTGPFCNQCGWRNPPGARFCSLCGTPLQDLPAHPAAAALASSAKPVSTLPLPDLPPRSRAAGAPAGAAGPEEQGRVSRQVGLLVGAGVLLVIALYLVTVFSKDVPGAAAPAATGGEGAASRIEAQESVPLPPEIADQVAALEAEAARLEGAPKREKQRQLVNLLIGAGRVDRAALEQEEVARAEDTAEAWTRAGNLFYDWVDTVAGAQRADVARRGIAAYQRALELDPDNLDVRTDMAWLYQFDDQNPMQAIVQTNLVLEQDSTHVPANFNKGIFLLQINRLDQAMEQFERVKQLVGAGSPIYAQADQIVQTIRERRASPGS